MSQRVKRLMKEYDSGRRVVLLALYKVIQSVLQDVLGREYTGHELKSAAANVVNRMVLHPESRPDPRGRDDALGKELRSLTDLRLANEAAALVLAYDVFSGLVPDPAEGASRLAKAHAIGGPDFPAVLSMINPISADPTQVRELADSLADRLVDISEMDIREELWGTEGLGEGS